MKLKVFLPILLSHALLCALSARQPGFIDTTFKSSGGPNSSVTAVARQSNGKLLIIGDFTAVGGEPRNRVARLLSNGRVDPSFDPGGGPNNTVTAMALQKDGKVLIGGDFSAYNGTSRSRIARLNRDGSLDGAFNPLGTVDGTVMAIVAQPDGKVVIGGSFSNVNGVPREKLARLLPDGKLDTTFVVGDGTNGNIQALALEPDGDILLGGSFSTYNMSVRGKIARVNPSGGLDGTFAVGAGASGDIYAIEIDKLGRVLIGGDFSQYDGTARSRIARLTSLGALDTTFVPGTGFDSYVYDIAVQPDGRLLTCGEFEDCDGTYRRYLARLRADGSLDPTFDPGVGAYNACNALAIQPDGKVVVVGGFDRFNDLPYSYVARVTAAGKLDRTFNAGSGPDSAVNALVVQPDGAVLVGGSFDHCTATPRRGIARLKNNGDLDTSFNPGSGLPQGSANVQTMALQPDGRVLIGGGFSTYDSVARSNIARVNANGTLDTTFNPGSGVDASVLAMGLQSDGKVMIGGIFSSYNGTGRSRVARVLSTGALDTTFVPGSGPDSTVGDLVIQADGKCIIVGDFITYGGSTASHIARLTTTGLLDTTFVTGTGANNAVTCVELQPDGKVLIGGRFTSFNGSTERNLTRLNTNGSVDVGFGIGTGFDGTVEAIAVQPDGKIVVGGTFTAYNGISRRGLVRLLEDGSLDTSFDPGAGLQSLPYVVALQQDAKLLIGGNLSSFDGHTISNLTRVHLGYAHAATSFSGITQGSGAAGIRLIGRVSLALTTTGGYSASLVTGGETVRWTGAFDFNGESLTTGVRKDKSQVLIDLALARGDRGGPMVDGGIRDFSGNAAALRAHAPWFSGSGKPASHYHGSYRVALQTPGPVAGAMPPSGDGFLNANISMSGAVTLSGRAADGSPLTASATLDQNDQILLHLPLYRGGGFINGQLWVNDTILSPQLRPVFGTVRWLRPTQPGTSYATGFDVTLLADGSQYVAKPATEPPFGGTANNSVQFSVAGGNLSAAGLSTLMRFTPAGDGVEQMSGPVPSLKLKVNRSAGSFSGSFIPTGHTKPVTLQGVLINRTYARGYALIPTTPGLSAVLPSTVVLQVVIP